MVLDRVALGLSGPAKLSGLVLALANMVPVIGVIIWDWRVFDVVALYWAENIIIGIFNIPRLMMAQGQGDGMTSSATKYLLVPFFLFHYGLFCLVHGVFVFVLLFEGDPVRPSILAFPGILADVGATTIWALGCLIVSHLFSFFWNYIGQREYRETVPKVQMFQPYGRIVVLHIAILFGAFALVMMGSPIILLLILIAGKTALDLGFHFYSHAKEQRVSDEVAAAPSTV